MSPADPRLRVSDADRERAMADLSGHYADGRLDHEEYDERLDAIWTARTRADLAVLFSDLPRLQPAPPPAQHGRETRSRGRGFRLPLMPVLMLLIALSILTHAPFWLLVFPLMFFMGGRRRRTCGPPHQGRGPGGTDYRRPARSHGW
ncbi:DUF1707 SHOCT-like domain-containing protein [Nocardioides hwasunensis]|uniref:DUF1707 domain-containing protein n=1 Tax=Nocardioides hwasunensis TaxID=397258 RepID=A0ABR8MFC2_9ACTN|nr:DUF1707 domain-containing protein [Nocardioides hwasunensis]MBD3914275.1 DUF1707 domain-containing protein [Nocardioides hwasunensis]